MPRSVFEIIGPVMIGPSSSHTAGAVRIGRFARAVLSEPPVRATIFFYGSFARTYKGHGTDRAIVGGLLGMATDDSRIKAALDIAREKGLCIDIKTGDLPDVHPNTMEISLTGGSGVTIEIRGSSIGGGNILVSKINQFEVGITGRYPALLVEHIDKPGVVGLVTTELGKHSINIAEMRMARSQKGANNFMVIETDQPILDTIMESVVKLPGIINLRKIEPF